MISKNSTAKSSGSIKIKNLFILVIMLFILVSFVSAAVPVMDDVHIEYNGSEVGIYATANDTDNDSLKYECNLYRNGSYLSTKNIYWENNNDVRNGLYTSYSELDGALCYNCTGTGYWEIMIGVWGGSWHDYYNDTASQWQTDGGYSGWGSNIVNGLATGSKLKIETLYNFTGDGSYVVFTRGAGAPHGYQWNGTSWVTDDSLVSGISSNVYTMTAGFNVTGDGLWKMISHDSSNTKGYSWNGTNWNLDAALMCGICDASTCHPSKGGYYPNFVYLMDITGEDKWGYIANNASSDIMKKTWNGTCWVNDDLFFTGVSYGVSTSSMDISYDFNVTGTGQLEALIGGSNRAGFSSWSIIPPIAQGVEANVVNDSANQGETWIASCRAHDRYDGASYSSWMNGTLLINSPPILQSIADVNITVIQSLSNQTVCSDPQGDTLYYYVNDSMVSINATGFLFDDPVFGDKGTRVIAVTCGDGEYNVTENFYYTVTWPVQLSTFTNYSCADTIPLEGATTVVECFYNVLSYDDNLTSSAVVINLSSSQLSANCSSFYNYTLVDYRSYCNITINYYDLPGYYDADFSFYDNVHSQSVSSFEKSAFEYYQLLASSYEVAFEAEAVTGDNTTYSEFIVNNTGNTVLSNTSIKAYDLVGSQITDVSLSADVFSVNSVDDVDNAVQLQEDAFVQIPSMSIGLGMSKNFYLYIDIPQDQYPQMYYGTWLMLVS